MEMCLSGVVYQTFLTNIPYIRSNIHVVVCLVGKVTEHK